MAKAHPYISEAVTGKRAEKTLIIKTVGKSFFDRNIAALKVYGCVLHSTNMASEKPASMCVTTCNQITLNLHF